MVLEEHRSKAGHRGLPDGLDMIQSSRHQRGAAVAMQIDVHLSSDPQWPRLSERP